MKDIYFGKSDTIKLQPYNNFRNHKNIKIQLFFDVH